MKIIWLASYPKSGNTYLRFLLYNYLYGEPKSSTDIGKKIPDLHKIISKKKSLNLNLDNHIFCKTHYIFTQKHPYINQTSGAIYLLRNPRDVLLSNLRYFQMIKSGPVEPFSFAANFLDNYGVEQWKKFGYGSWPQHVSSWMAGIGQFPLLFIKYESLRDDTKETLEKVIRFIGQDVDREKVKESIEQASIQNMKKMEVREKESQSESLFAGNINKGTFVGEGNSNQSLSHISNEVENAYREKFSNFLQIFGY